MVTTNRPLIERCSTAGILLLAVLLAWMIVDRPDEALPKKVAVEPTPAPESAQHFDAPSTSAIAAALAVELVEIAEPPPRAAVAPTQSTAPAPEPPQQVVRETPPAPIAEPPHPQLVREVMPLQPSPPPQAVTSISHREPEPVEAREVVPLKPTPAQVKPEPPAVRRPPPREEKIEPEVTPLRPTPVKPPPAPEVMRVNAPPRPTPPKPAPAPEQSSPSPVMNVAAVMGEGRAFLKILEQGAGPGIEIRWPSDSVQRDRLYGALVQCLGMRTGLLDGNGRLYLGEGQKGQPSALDGERYSGFVRRPEGVIAREEEREIARVRSYHQVAAGASAARIFPRRVDVYLIGGLRALVGDNYLKTKSIRASYRLKNGAPVVDSIVADGRRIDGLVDLSAVANSCSG